MSIAGVLLYDNGEYSIYCLDCYRSDDDWLCEFFSSTENGRGIWTLTKEDLGSFGQTCFNCSGRFYGFSSLSLIPHPEYNNEGDRIDNEEPHSLPSLNELFEEGVPESRPPERLP
jgi:hypothetical protein